MLSVRCVGQFDMREFVCGFDFAICHGFDMCLLRSQESVFVVVSLSDVDGVSRGGFDIGEFVAIFFLRLVIGSACAHCVRSGVRSLLFRSVMLSVCGVGQLDMGEFVAALCLRCHGIRTCSQCAYFHRSVFAKDKTRVFHNGQRREESF